MAPAIAPIDLDVALPDPLAKGEGCIPTAAATVRKTRLIDVDHLRMKGDSSRERGRPIDAAPASAVALRYADGDAAPVVVAKGRGAVAEEIVRRARDAGVFVHESSDLVALLMQVDLDARIPPALYIAVAELLAWLARVDRGIALPEGVSP